MIDTLF